MTYIQELYILEGASFKGLFPTQIKKKKKKDPYQALLTSSYTMELNLGLTFPLIQGLYTGLAYREDC